MADACRVRVGGDGAVSVSRAMPAEGSVPQPPPGSRGWFADPWSDGLLRYWFRGRWTDELVMAPVHDAGKYRPYHPLRRGIPHPLPLRAAAVVTIGAFAIACLALLNGGAWRRSPDDVGLWRPLCVAAVFVVWAVMAQQVDYRWFDAVLIVVPIYGWWWMAMIAWRITNVPYRNWAPRPEVLAADPTVAALMAQSRQRRLDAEAALAE